MLAITRKYHIIEHFLTYLIYAVSLIVLVYFAMRGHFIVGLAAGVFLLFFLAIGKKLAYQWLFSISPLCFDLCKYIYDRDVSGKFYEFNHDHTMPNTEPDDNMCELVISSETHELARVFVSVRDGNATASVFRVGANEVPVILKPNQYYFMYGVKTGNDRFPMVYLHPSIVFFIVQAVESDHGYNSQDAEHSFSLIPQYSTGKYLDFRLNCPSSSISMQNM